MNPDRNNTLHIDDNFDENKFLMNYNGNNESEVPKTADKLQTSNIDESLDRIKLDKHSSMSHTNKNKSFNKHKVNLSHFANDDDEFEMEDRKEEISRQRPAFNDFEEEDDAPVKRKDKMVEEN